MANKNFAVKNGLDVAGDATLTGDLTVLGADIKGPTGTTGLTLDQFGNVNVAGDLTISGNELYSGTGRIAYLVGTELELTGSLRIDGNTIKASDNATNITMTSNTLTTFAGDIKVTGNDIQNNQGLSNITLGSSLTQPSITVGTVRLNGVSGYVQTTTGALNLLGASTVTITDGIRLHSPTVIGSATYTPPTTPPLTVYSITSGSELVRGSTSASTNIPLYLVKDKTATARAVNDGVAIYSTFRNTTSDVTGAAWSTVCTDATAGSEDYDFTVRLMQNGAAIAEKFRVASTGDATIQGDVRVNGNDIQCSSGASTITMTSANTATTIRGNTIYLQDSASAAICGSFVSYSRQYGDFANLNTIVPAAANTAYAFALPTTNNANGISITSTSRITCSNPGNYNLQFSVQWENTDNGSDHNLYIWLRYNGVDVANTGGRITCVKNSSGIAAWNYIAAAAAANDYFELMYSVDDTAIQMPYIAASSPVPAIPSVILTMVPVGV